MKRPIRAGVRTLWSCQSATTELEIQCRFPKQILHFVIYRHPSMRSLRSLTQDERAFVHPEQVPLWGTRRRVGDSSFLR